MAVCVRFWFILSNLCSLGFDITKQLCWDRWMYKNLFEAAWFCFFSFFFSFHVIDCLLSKERRKLYLEMKIEKFHGFWNMKRIMKWKLLHKVCNLNFGERVVWMLPYLWDRVFIHVIFVFSVSHIVNFQLIIIPKFHNSKILMIISGHA